MRTKKRNMVMEILVCTVLVSVVFLGYMCFAKDNSGLKITDISGDRTVMNAFAFNGIAGDESGYHHFTWNEGELKTKYYPANAQGMDALLTAEKEGDTFGKYFAEYRYSLSDVDAEVTPVPVNDVKKKSISGIDELSEENKSALEEKLNMVGYRHYGNMVEGVVTDKIHLYGELTDYDHGRCARFDTGLTFSGKEYYFTKWNSTMGDQIYYEASEGDYGISFAENEDAYYAILKTDDTCNGEVFLQKIPKKDMHQSWGGNHLWQDTVIGKSEILVKYSVDRDHRIIGLAEYGDDRLLIARSENDILFIDLYDTKGNLITELKTDVEQVSQYELFNINMNLSGDQMLLWFELPRRVYREGTDPNDFHYEVDGVKYFLCDQNSITDLNVKGYLEYLDYADGKVLMMEHYTSSGNEDLDHLMGYSVLGYDLKVMDATTGEMLYEGVLETDFHQDYFRMLTVLNIGKRDGFISEQKNGVWDRWDWEISRRTEIRAVRTILPLNGELSGEDWSEGAQNSYSQFRYY